MQSKADGTETIRLVRTEINEVERRLERRFADYENRISDTVKNQNAAIAGIADSLVGIQTAQMRFATLLDELPDKVTSRVALSIYEHSATCPHKKTKYSSLAPAKKSILSSDVAVKVGIGVGSAVAAFVISLIAYFLR
jgi:hypothetical protein